jgi:phage-related protein (TIGR01555 family)
MSLRQRLSTAIARRLDSGPMEPPILPPPAGPSLLERVSRRTDSIVNALTGLGGWGDKGAAARPNPYWTPLTEAELTTLYRRNGYARRFVDIVPAETTRSGWKVVDDTKNPELMKEENERLQVQATIAKAYSSARLRGGALILMVTEDDIPPAFRLQPGSWLAQPLDVRRVKRLLNLVVIHRREANVAEFEGDIRVTGQFRAPKLWSINPTAAITGLVGSNLVHASRVLYVPGAELPDDLRYENQGWDDSVLEAVWDQIRQKTSVDQGGGVLVQEMRTNVLKVQGLAALKTGDQAELYQTRMKLMAQSLGLMNMVIVGEEEEFDSRAASLTGYKDLDTAAKEALAAVTGIPLATLFGEAPGGLNADGESHRATWNQAVAACQERFLRPILTTLYRVMYAQKEGPARGSIPKSWKVEFCPLEEPTRKQIADHRKTVAETDQILIDSGVVSPEHVARSRYGEDGWQDELLPISDEEIDELALERAAQEAAELEASAGAEDEDEPQDGENAPVPAK